MKIQTAAMFMELVLSDFSGLEGSCCYCSGEAGAEMRKRISALPLEAVHYIGTGDYHYQTLFWLYYPEARPLFAKTEAFNPHNSAMRQSYDDVFAWNRYFQSYIYKIDNLQNQTVEYFYPDIKTQLRESDRIEEMLFEIEHDLWVY